MTPCPSLYRLAPDGLRARIKNGVPSKEQRACCSEGTTSAPLMRASLRGARPLQQPRQIDPIILSTFASSRSMAGLVPSSGPFIGWAVPDDESAVPAELVPGAEGLVPAAPPVTEPWCDPMPPPRANAVAVERLTKRATQRTESFFMPRLPRTRDLINVTVDRRCACM